MITQKFRTAEEAFNDIEKQRKSTMLEFFYIMASIASLVMALVFMTLGHAAHASMDPYLQGKKMTKRYEGFRGNQYACPAGKPTIGYGFNLELPANRALIDPDVLSGKRKLGRDEADRIFDEVYARAAEDARLYLGDAWWKLDTARREIIIDMAYSMGHKKLKQFRKLKSAINAGDFNLAAAEIKNSKWYNDVQAERAEHHFNGFK